MLVTQESSGEKVELGRDIGCGGVFSYSVSNDGCQLEYDFQATSGCTDGGLKGEEMHTLRLTISGDTLSGTETDSLFSCTTIAFAVAGQHTMR